MINYLPDAGKLHLQQQLIDAQAELMRQHKPIDLGERNARAEEDYLGLLTRRERHKLTRRTIQVVGIATFLSLWPIAWLAANAGEPWHVPSILAGLGVMAACSYFVDSEYTTLWRASDESLMLLVHERAGPRALDGNAYAIVTAILRERPQYSGIVDSWLKQTGGYLTTDELAHVQELERLCQHLDELRAVSTNAATLRSVVDSGLAARA